MNKVVMMGRLVGDPKISYSKNGNAMAIARYRLAVARKSKKQGEAAADFFSCVVFGKSAEFAVFTQRNPDLYFGAAADRQLC